MLFYKINVKCIIVLEEMMTGNTFVHINKTYYIYDRYNTIATFALMYHEKELSEEQLANYLRISDQFIKIDNNHYFITFTYCSQKDAFKASQNLLLHLDNFFHNASTCIAIDTFNTSYSPQVVLNRLKQILLEIRKSSYSRIEDEIILSEIF